MVIVVLTITVLSIFYGPIFAVNFAHLDDLVASKSPGQCLFTADALWQYDLMRHITDIHYNVSLHLEHLFKHSTFDGHLTITFKSTDDFASLALNSKSDLITIKSAELTNFDCGKKTSVQFTQMLGTDDVVTGQVKDIGTKHSRFQLIIKYSAKLPDNGKVQCGLIVDKTNEFAMTFFEPRKARWVLPSFDHPSMKATFMLSVKHNIHETALSNTPELSNHKIDEFQSVTVFEKTMKLPTYLFAFSLLGNHKVYSNDQSADHQQLPVRVFCPVHVSERIHTGSKQVAEFGAHYFTEIQNFMGFDRRLKKLDFVVADFEFGAMENDGLVQMSFKAMSDDQKMKTTTIHEIIHHWIGNLITLTQWSDLCLQEGLTTYLSDQFAMSLVPDYNSHRSLIRTEQRALHNEMNLAPLTDARSMPNCYKKGQLIFQLLNDSFRANGVETNPVQVMTQILVKMNLWGNVGLFEWTTSFGTVAGRILKKFMTELGLIRVSVNRKGDDIHFVQHQMLLGQQLHNVPTLPIVVSYELSCGKESKDGNFLFDTKSYTLRLGSFLSAKKLGECTMIVNKHWRSKFLVDFEVNV